MEKHQGDLTTYPAKFLDCRPGMSGHAWKWKGDFKIVRNTRGDIIEFSRKMKCGRCKTERTKVYGRNGMLLRKPSYRYWPGYVIDSQSFEVEPGMAALEALRRAMDGGHAEEVVVDEEV